MLFQKPSRMPRHVRRRIRELLRQTRQSVCVVHVVPHGQQLDNQFLFGGQMQGVGHYLGRAPGDGRET